QTRGFILKRQRKCIVFTAHQRHHDEMMIFHIRKKHFLNAVR
ncbi:hypothetical protein HMPREF1590_01113, partial [Escherichia coli 113302]